MILLVKGEPLGGQGLTWPISTLDLFLPFIPLPPRPSKTVPPFIILPLTPDYLITLSNAKQFYSSKENLLVGKG